MGDDFGAVFPVAGIMEVDATIGEIFRFDAASELEFDVAGIEDSCYDEGRMIEVGGKKQWARGPTTFDSNHYVAVAIASDAEISA